MRSVRYVFLGVLIASCVFFQLSCDPHKEGVGSQLRDIRAQSAPKPNPPSSPPRENPSNPGGPQTRPTGPKKVVGVLFDSVPPSVGARYVPSLTSTDACRVPPNADPPLGCAPSNDSDLIAANAKAAEMLRAVLSKTDQVRVISRSDLEKVLPQEVVQKAHGVDLSSAIKLRESLGVQVLILGRVSQRELSKDPVMFKATIEMQVLDVVTGRRFLVSHSFGDESEGISGVASKQRIGRIDSIDAKRRLGTGFEMSGVGGVAGGVAGALVGARLVSGSFEEQLPQAIENVSVKLLAALQTAPWSGRITGLLSLDSVYIDGGFDVGLQPDLVLNVYRLEKERENLLGQLRLIDVQERFSIATSIGDVGFQIDDIVRLSQKKALQKQTPDK